MGRSFRASGIDGGILDTADAEARVIPRLTARLQDGPPQAASHPDTMYLILTMFFLKKSLWQMKFRPNSE